MTRNIRRTLPVILAAIVMSCSAYAQVTVILTRHAEKAASPANDPPLTDAGRKRSELFASMFADSGIDAIFVTEVQRTQQTAAPLAERTHVKQTIIRAADRDQLLSAIRSHASGVVVVVGHSNTVPAIIAALGGPAVKIEDPAYDNLFILTVGPSQSSLLRMHYGDSTPVPPAGGTMAPGVAAAPVK